MKIRIQVDEEPEHEERKKFMATPTANPRVQKEVMDFLCTLMEYTGLEAQISLIGHEPGKIVLNIDSDDTNLLIGKKGKNINTLKF